MWANLHVCFSFVEQSVSWFPISSPGN